LDRVPIPVFRSILDAQIMLLLLVFIETNQLREELVGYFVDRGDLERGDGDVVDVQLSDDRGELLVVNSV
jgi:hypothetical protein